MADAYRDVAWASGAIDTGFIPFWLGLVSVTSLAPDTLMSDPVAAANAIGAHVSGATDFQTKVLAGGTTGGEQAYDGAFYRERSPINVVDKVNVPTFVVGGEFDIFQRGEPMLYSALRRNGVPTRLLLGPWYHTTAGNGLPSQNVPSVEELELRWFDHYVRGVADPMLKTDVAPVTYFENGTGKWRTASNYLNGVDFRAYHLGGTAQPGTPGTLGKAGSGSDTLPWVPVTGPCSRGTTQWTAGLASGIPCETDNSLNDTYGLSYDLPVKHTLRLRGPIAAHLFVESNGRDALISARIEDVAPDGTVTQLTAGWQTLGLRALNRAKSRWVDGHLVQPFHPYTKSSLLTVPSGKVVPVDVEIFPTAAAILPGHTLRLTLQPADEPHLTPPLPQAVNSAGAVLTFVHDARHPSSVVLPVGR
jgi:putative CocE/NonD family hydrolase